MNPPDSPDSQEQGRADARERETVADFQRQQREFKPRWNRNIGFVFFPGFVLLALAAIFDLRLLAILAIPLLLVGAARGARLVLRYRRCPVCGAIQTPSVRYPHRTCITCGARLSIGVKDST